MTAADEELEVLRGLFEHAPGLVAVLGGADHVFELANEACRRVIGRAREVIGLPAREVLPEVIPQGYFEVLDQVRRSGEPFVGRGLVARLERTPGGPLEAVTLDLVFQPMKAPDGTVRRIFVQGHDISAQVTAAEAEREARARAAIATEERAFLVDALPNQVWSAHPDGRIAAVNQRVSHYFGVPAEQIVDEGWHRFVHPDDVERCFETWARAFREGVSYECELRLLRASDRTFRWHIARALPRRGEGGEILRWYGSSTDIDDLKRTERERDALIEALSVTNRELDQFAYVASHDLRAPLRGIANLAQWIEADLGDAPAETRRHLVMLRERVLRMDAMIDAVLKYSRAGRVREIELSEVDLGRMLAEVIELIAPPPTATIELPRELPRLRAEAIALQQVWMNLVCNAVKHSRRVDPRIVIGAARVLEAGRPMWRFSVTDNGPGIEPRFQDRIWVLFHTLQPRDEVEGSGIGLTIAKKLVESRGGRIGVDSTPGAGATFWFTWPEG